MVGGWSAPACTAIVVFLATSLGTGESNSEDIYEDGDSWTYDMDMTIGSLSLSGTYTETFDGESSHTVAGYSYSTYDIAYFGTLSVSGIMWDHAVSGTATISGVDSLDQDSLDVVVSDSELSMAYSIDIDGIPMAMEYSEHNVSTISPPNGVGEEPSHPDEYEVWTKTYNVHSETTVNDNGDIYTESSSFTTAEVYTYIGVQTITVPAGTFKCEVVRTDDGEGISMNWYCDEAGTVVKSEYEAGYQTGAMRLKSFSYTPPPSGGLSSLTVLMIAAAAIAGAAMAALALALRRRKSRREGRLVSPEMEVGLPPPPAG